MVTGGNPVSYEAIEDDELLAPQGYGNDDADAGDPEDSEDTADIEGEWVIAHGFPDTKRALRIWVDEDTRHLTKVRLSTRWRDRLGTKSLDDAFTEAFFLANARVGGVPTLEVPQQDEPEVDPTLTWEDYERLTARAQDLLDESNELDARAPEDVRWADFQGERASASSANGNVTVTLSLAGLTDSVSFDKKWLAKARMSEITDAVMSAHTKAYERYVPPTFVPGEHEDLAQKLAEVQAALNFIVSKGF